MSDTDHMFTKHDNPCITKAADDEPLFVLRAQDVSAPDLVRQWASANSLNAPNKAESARRIADRMEAWHTRKLADDA